MLHLMSEEHVIDDGIIRDELLLLFLHRFSPGSSLFDPLHIEERRTDYALESNQFLIAMSITMAIPNCLPLTIVGSKRHTK